MFTVLDLSHCGICTHLKNVISCARTKPDEFIHQIGIQKTLNIKKILILWFKPKTL